MGAFGGLVLTNKGRNLQVKAQSGVQLNFTRIAIGDGYLGGSSILDLNALKSEKKSLSITKLKTLSDGKVVVGAVLSNQDMADGFYFREIGVFAQDPDVGEILYCYGNAGDTADYIPASGTDVIEKSLDVVTIVGNAQNVSATIEQSLVFVTTQELQAHIDDNTNPHNVTPEQIGAAKDADLNAHTAQTATAHGATSAATANTLMARDANGRAKVAAPAAADDIARKDTVDAVQANLNTHAALTSTAHGATSAATASTLMARDASGRAKVAAPVAADDIARKDTVDNALNNHTVAADPHPQYTKFATGSYTGDGIANRQIVVGFQPKLVHIWNTFVSGTAQRSHVITPQGGYYITGSSPIYLAPAPGMVLTITGFQTGDLAQNGNQSGYQYTWAAWG